MPRITRCLIDLAMMSRHPALLERVLELHTATRTVLDVDPWKRAATALGGSFDQSPALRRYLSCMRGEPMTFSQRLQVRQLEKLAAPAAANDAGILPTG